MTELTKLLEATLQPRKVERALATGTTEAFERYLRFQPQEFYREAEHKINAELFLEHLTHIYDT